MGHEDTAELRVFLDSVYPSDVNAPVTGAGSEPVPTLQILIQGYEDQGLVAGRAPRQYAESEESHLTSLAFAGELPSEGLGSLAQGWFLTGLNQGEAARLLGQQQVHHPPLNDGGANQPRCGLMAE